MKRRSNVRRVIYACALAGLLSVTLIAMVDYVGVDTIQRYIPFANLPLIVAAILVFFVMTMLLVLRGVPRIVEMARRAETLNPLPRLPITFNRKSVLVCAAIVFVCWIPYIALQYPCAMFWDTYDQLYQFRTSAPTLYPFLDSYVNVEYIDHHPVFDTLIFGSFVWLGDMLGSQNAGLFLYMLCQSALTAFSLALSCCFLDRLGVPKALRLLSLLFVALFPLIPLWATCMSKDGLFSPLFVIYFVFFAEAFKSKGERFANPRFLLAYILIAGLCILTKKSGVCIVALSTVSLFIVNRGSLINILASVVAPIAVFAMLVPSVLYPLVGGVEPGGKQEILGFMYQQVVTAIRSNPESVTEEEVRGIEGVLYLKPAVLQCDSIIVDPVKNNAKINLNPSDYIDFFISYASIGVRHPIEYTRSVVNVCAPLVAPGVGMTYYASCGPMENWQKKFDAAANAQDFNISFYKPEPIRTWASNVEAAYLNLVETNPFAAILLSRGLFGGWIPFCCILLAACNNRKYWVAYAPIIVSIAVLVVSPAGSTRYMLPLLYVLPLMLGLLYLSFRDAKAAP